MTLISLIYKMIFEILRTGCAVGFYVVYKKGKKSLFFWIMLLFFLDLLDSSIVFIGDVIPTYAYIRTAGLSNVPIIAFLKEFTSIACFYLMRRVSAQASGLNVSRVENAIWGIVCVVILVIKLSAYSSNRIVLIAVLCTNIIMYSFSIITAIINLHRIKADLSKNYYTFWMIILLVTQVCYLAGIPGNIMMINGRGNPTGIVSELLWDAYVVLGIAYLYLVIKKQPAIDFDLSILNARKKYLLTDREGEILRLIIQDRSNAEICQELTIAPGTTKTHIHNICQKMGAHNKQEIKSIMKKSI